MRDKLKSSQPRAVLFTRFPVAGAAKTRLIPAVGAEGAAAIHKILTERTVETLLSCDCQVEIAFTGATEKEFRDWLGNDPTYVEQRGDDLTDRLLERLSPAPVLFLGSDTPALETRHIKQALSELQSHDAVIGPAEDGGYYCIGLNNEHEFLFREMSWSTDQVFPETVKRMDDANISYALLETLSDCDTPEDLARWPWLNRLAKQ